MSPPSVNTPYIKTPAYVIVSSKWFKENADDIINKLDKKILLDIPPELNLPFSPFKFLPSV